MDPFSSHPLYKKHNLDSVMSSIWSFYKKNFLVLFLVSFIVNLGLQYLSSFIDISGITITTEPNEVFAIVKEWIWPMAGTMAGSILMSLVLHFYVIYKPVDSSVNIFNSIYRSLKYLIPFILILILFVIFASMAMVAGLIVFIIGAAFAMFYVFMIGLFILPLLMVEGNDIGNAISRTFTLSHRHFGSNLGWTAILLVIILVSSLIISSIILLPFSGSFLKILTNPEEAGEAMNFLTNPWYIILSALASSLFTPLIPIFATILCFNGKAREEDIHSTLTGINEPDKVRVEDLYAKPYSDDHPDNPENR